MKNSYFQLPIATSPMCNDDDDADEDDEEKEDWIPNTDDDLDDGSKTFQRIGSPPICHTLMINMMI